MPAPGPGAARPGREAGAAGPRRGPLGGGPAGPAPPDPDAPAPQEAPATPAKQALAAALEQAADPADPTFALDHARWLRGWLHRRARPLTAQEATRLHRLRAQAAGLLAEAEALATFL
ncbi:hypothetical protein [Hymenobacter cellulosilyticus]|uniref:Uncharacterized protein n=1 Tax=Hymenobacter cellulosilyticus TaxID=2932248 RepID=A0A8T9Q4V4_9BACT|nr:hypothetical protein [Hymenobacter cellulosilyticus]UOQ71461.1 hypothetical protein MUN79_23030 [Hymenobacter cellulosilyticus]